VVLAGNFTTLLEGIVAHPDTRIEEFPLLGVACSARWIPSGETRSNAGRSFIPD
jgi:hypothetical protein